MKASTKKVICGIIGIFGSLVGLGTLLAAPVPKALLEYRKPGPCDSGCTLWSRYGYTYTLFGSATTDYVQYCTYDGEVYTITDQADNYYRKQSVAVAGAPTEFGTGVVYKVYYNSGSSLCTNQPQSPLPASASVKYQALIDNESIDLSSGVNQIATMSCQ